MVLTHENMVRLIIISLLLALAALLLIGAVVDFSAADGPHFTLSQVEFIEDDGLAVTGGCTTSGGGCSGA